VNPRESVVDCDEYFVGKPEASFKAELLLKAFEKD